jgi:hypothetical protein
MLGTDSIQDQGILIVNFIFIFMLIFFICNEIIRVDSYTSYILLWSDLNWTTLLLPGTLLQLLTPINLSAYKENLQPFITIGPIFI